MNPIKLLVIIGTRPEAIKLAPLVLAGHQRSEQFAVSVCLTGQHREMTAQVTELFGIEPDVDLDIMAPNQDLFDVTTRALSGLKGVLDRAQPDCVVVQGDTTTAFAGGLAAFYQQIPVAHIEAGLRTGNLLDPWPEEGNRRLLSALARFHFAPTDRCRANLEAEGIPAARIVVTGNTVIDALEFVSRRLAEDGPLRAAQVAAMVAAGFPLAEYLGCDARYILVTCHRRESFGAGFLSICEGLKRIALANPDLGIVYPVHLNPRVREPAFSLLRGIGNVYLIEPIAYLPFVLLMKHAYLILTDSGGIQEEAPTLGKPVLVMRKTTERPEGVAAGTSRLVGTKATEIENQVQRLLDDRGVYDAMAHIANPFGDGQASRRCLDHLVATRPSRGRYD